MVLVERTCKTPSTVAAHRHGLEHLDAESAMYAAEEAGARLGAANDTHRDEAMASPTSDRNGVDPCFTLEEVLG